MKRDWLDMFLPLWALASVAWITVAFVLKPVAFQRPMLYSPNAVWTTTLFDLTRVDMEVARALAFVFGPPTVLIVAALSLVAVEMLSGKRREKRPENRR